MIEIIVFGLLALAIAAYFFLPSQRSNAIQLAKELKVPEDSVQRRHFLTHLRTENALIATELEKLLAKGC
ncbi:MAG: hypothetical protein PHH59_15925 [Methylovulum sp.]|uniref:hypothetical protein n=1 Tax=Methylovulum sp. TaxID=1916980 RepID=UPI0026281AA3|nr:hypothetical protein [Methylovulum sp.]MDD2725495.1 hypothetical protein [Methylovulum sp.]MDD5125147.1 hypothetical protein [Methylovulum sp.]